MRRFEKHLGINREGRSVWVWALPPGVGVVSAVVAGLLPGIPAEVGWPFRVMLALFALVTMTALSVIYMISFDNDTNQEADS